MKKQQKEQKGGMGSMASWWAGELLLLFPSVSPVTMRATRRVCKEKEEYIITRQRQEGKEYCCIYAYIYAEKYAEKKIEDGVSLFYEYNLSSFLLNMFSTWRQGVATYLSIRSFLPSVGRLSAL